MNEIKHCKELLKGVSTALNDVFESWRLGILPDEDPDVYEQAEHMLRVYKRFLENED